MPATLVRRDRMRRISCGGLMCFKGKSPGESALACSATRIGSGAQRRPLCRRYGSLSTSTLRMRRCRDRQRAGSRVVMIELYYDDLDGLTALGQIDDPDGLDQRALAAAVADYLTHCIRRDCRARDVSQGSLPGVASYADDSED